MKVDPVNPFFRSLLRSGLSNEAKLLARVDRSVDTTQEARKRCCLLEISALKQFVTRILKIGKRFSGAWDDKPMG
jgi:hypothetical protein